MKSAIRLNLDKTIKLYRVGDSTIVARVGIAALGVITGIGCERGNVAKREEVRRRITLHILIIWSRVGTCDVLGVLVCTSHVCIEVGLSGIPSTL